MKKLEENYIKDDYELLLNELRDQINKSIEMLDFEIMSDYLGKIKNCEKKIESAENIIKLLKEVEINKKVKKIIFQNDNNKFKYDFKFNENKTECIHNIEQFIKCFINLKEYNELYIKNYLDFIFSVLEKEEGFCENKDELWKIKDKIYDYIFIKLYDKLYPQKPTQIDSLILINCKKLSWVESKHFIRINFDFNIFMNEITYYFNLLEKERNPKEKLNKIIFIFEIISKVISFVGFESNESEDKIYINILKYIIICVGPKRLNSDIEYIKLFSYRYDDESMKRLKLLNEACNSIKNIKYSDLIDISEEEFKQKCEQALLNNI